MGPSPFRPSRSWVQTPRGLRRRRYTADGDDYWRQHPRRHLRYIDAIPPVASRLGRPRKRPDTVVVDKDCDSRKVREALQHRRITPIIARRGTKGIIGLGKIRWVVERTISWLHQYKRLAIRWEHHADLHNGLTSLACALIRYRQLKQTW